MTKRFLKNENGLTLIEVLAGLAIFSLIMIIIYGVLISGVSLFHKGSTETLMRQDADIVMSHIINAFFETSGSLTEDDTKEIIVNYSSSNFEYFSTANPTEIRNDNEGELIINFRIESPNSNTKVLELDSTLIYPW